MQQRASKKQLLSSCSLAMKSSTHFRTKFDVFGRDWNFGPGLSSVETRQMSQQQSSVLPQQQTSVLSQQKTRRLLAAGQQLLGLMYSIKTGLRPVAIVDICLVSTCTSEDRKAHYHTLVSFSMQDGTKREEVSWKLSAAFS